MPSVFTLSGSGRTKQERHIRRKGTCRITWERTSSRTGFTRPQDRRVDLFITTGRGPTQKAIEASSKLKAIEEAKTLGLRGDAVWGIYAMECSGGRTNLPHSRAFEGAKKQAERLKRR